MQVVVVADNIHIHLGQAAQVVVVVVAVIPEEMVPGALAAVAVADIAMVAEVVVPVL
jgi:hypothetical protein